MKRKHPTSNTQHPTSNRGGRRAKKIVQTDRALPLKRGITETIFKRMDSSLWQVRFAGPSGKLVRVSTGTRSRTAALQALPMFKREVFRRAELPPPECVSGNATDTAELF